MCAFYSVQQRVDRLKQQFCRFLLEDKYVYRR